jgi:hypothetical protein
MYHLKMEKQTSNAKSVRTPTLPELFDDSKRSLLLPQVQANNHQQPANASQVNDNARQQAPAAPAAPQ